MSEMAKTLTFLVAGAAALLVGFVVGPKQDNFNVEELVGQRLNEFDIDAPKRLKIVRYDSETATAREFEVAEENGLWTIPSKSGYPADATRQMAEAATCVMDREILRIAATSASEHAALGVIDPTSGSIDSQSDGVGILVSMSDNNKDSLTDMIIGKEVVDQDGQYYVRKVNQDVVYVVPLDPEKLSTNFEDWIEDDLLKLNPFDISRVVVKDYSAELGFTLSGIRVNWDRRAEMTLDYDNGESKWSAASLKRFDPAAKEMTEFELAEDEQLNEDILSDLRNGLDDLRIVDVERKPSGLSADLKAGEDFLQDNSAATSLISRGFAPVGGEAEILSTEGEVICSLDTGVEYVLRFGNLQMETEDGQAPAEGEAAAAGEGINRYLFVMARFNEALIERPELDDLPSLPAGTTEADVEAATREDAEAAEQSAAEETTAEGSDNSMEEGEEVEEENEEEEEVPTEDGEATTETTAASGDETSEAETTEAENSPEAETSTESEASPETDAAESTDPPASEAEEDETEDELSTIIAERKRIEEANQRRLDEYQEKITEGKKTVDELNDRFGDWYYVISNEVYQQVHLELDKLIEKKDAAEGEDTEETTDAGLSGLPNLDFGAAPAAE